MKRFKGHLTLESIAAGMNAARSNARRLLADAELLAKADSYPSAAGLAALSIEESGKVSILRRLTTASSVDEVAACWREYRAHRSKNVMWPLLDLVRQGARRLEDFKPLFLSEAEHPELLDSVKQISFYTDCFDPAGAYWSEPSAVIDEGLSRTLIASARALAASSEVSVLELELWVRHMKPVQHAPMEVQERALAGWYAAMQKHGLAASGENVMERFIAWGLRASRDGR